MSNRALATVIEHAHKDVSNPYLDLSSVLRVDLSKLTQDLLTLNQKLWVMPHIRRVKLFPTYQICADTGQHLEPYQLAVSMDVAHLKYRVIGLDQWLRAGVIEWDDLPQRWRFTTKPPLSELSKDISVILAITRQRVHTFKLSRSMELILTKIIWNHPNIQSLELDPASGIDAHSITTSLEMNFSRFNPLIATVQTEEVLTSILTWMQRKALHTIRGGRSEELNTIYNTHYEFLNYCTESKFQLEDAQDSLKQTNQKIHRIYQDIVSENASHPLSPLEAEEGQTVQPWIETDAATRHIETWEAHFTERQGYLEKQGVTFTHNDHDLQLHQARKDPLCNFLSTALDESVAAWLRNIFDSLIQPSTATPLVSLLREIGSLSPMKVLEDRRFITDPTQTSPLAVAIECKNLEAFKTLLRLGADIFAYDELVKKIFDSESRFASFQVALAQHYQWLSYQLQDDARHCYHLGIRPDAMVRFTEQQKRQILTISSHINHYLGNNLLRRIKTNPILTLLSNCSPYYLLQKVSRTTKQDRVNQIISMLNCLRQHANDPAHFQDRLKQCLATYRASIFKKQKNTHLFSKVSTSIEILENATKYAAVSKRDAESAENELSDEYERRNDFKRLCDKLKVAEKRSHEARLLIQQEQQQSRVLVEYIGTQQEQINAANLNIHITSLTSTPSFQALKDRFPRAGRLFDHQAHVYHQALLFMRTADENHSPIIEELRQSPYFEQQLIEARSLPREEGHRPLEERTEESQPRLGVG